MYCPSIWFNTTDVTDVKKLNTAYNHGLRRLLNLPKYSSASEIFVNLKVPSFYGLLRKFVFCFKSRIMNLDNLLVNGIVRSCYTVI